MFGHDRKWLISKQNCLFCGKSLQKHEETGEIMCTWLKCKLFGGQYKMINIDGKYFIKATNKGFDLVKKIIIDKGKRAGQEDFQFIGSFGRISHVLEHYESIYKPIDAINAGVATNLESLKSILETIHKNALKVEARILEQLKPHQGGNIK